MNTNDNSSDKTKVLSFANHTALLIESEPAISTMMEIMLHRLGFSSFSVHTVEAALEQIRRQTFGVVISDFSPPKLDGVELAARIREIRPEQCIIIATAYPDELSGGSELRNVNKVLPKPFRISDLIGALHEILHRAAAI